MTKYLIYIILFVSGFSQAQLCFQPPVNFSVGYIESYITSADFNGDGKIDLAITNSNGADFWIMLGTGTGSFGAATNYTTGGYTPIYINKGDFNGDGKIDLVTANYGSNNVSLLLGNGLGAFGPSNNFLVGNSPWSVTISDFNGDTKLDLAVPNKYSDDVSILLGTGTGSFSPATNFKVANYPTSAAAADFNGDGKTDLAVSKYGYGYVSLLAGTGTGSFSVVDSFQVGSGPNAIISSDFNGDSKPDLATANYGGSFDSTVSVLLATGTGSFNPAVNYKVGTGPIQLVNSDYNGDGFTDLAVVNFFTFDLSILLGTATGSFVSATTFSINSLGFKPNSLTTADFNSDGKPDLAFDDLGYNDISVLLSCVVTGDNDLKNETGVFTYPNPVNQILNIRVNGIEIKNSEIEITNYLGQPVYEGSIEDQITSQKKEVDVSKLSQGFYNLKITPKNKEVYYSKFIKE